MKLSFELPSPQLAAFAGGADIYRRSGERADLTTQQFRVAPPPTRPPLDHHAATGTLWLNPSEIESSADPFPHLVGAPAMERSRADELLAWLESLTNWPLNDGGFYASFEKDLLREKPPAGLAPMFSDDARAAFARQAERIFGTPLEMSDVIAAHQMQTGHGIGIHTDMPRPEEETHRILIVLARPMPAATGGHFVMLSGADASFARRFIPIAHNTAIAFPLSDASHHAVTTLRAGRRFSIVFSFRPPRG